MSPTPWIANKYPSARRSDHLDEYKSEAKGRVQVADPYQWLEKNTPETEEWVTAQEAFTRAYLDKVSFPQVIHTLTVINDEFFPIVRTQIVSSWRTRSGQIRTMPR
jgi:hypothetical protein